MKDWKCQAIANLPRPLQFSLFLYNIGRIAPLGRIAHVTPETTTPNSQTNAPESKIAVIGERVRQFIDNLPQMVGDFFGTNRPLLVLVAIALFG